MLCIRCVLDVCSVVYTCQLAEYWLVGWGGGNIYHITLSVTVNTAVLTSQPYTCIALTQLFLLRWLPYTTITPVVQKSWQLDKVKLLFLSIPLSFASKIHRTTMVMGTMGWNNSKNEDSYNILSSATPSYVTVKNPCCWCYVSPYYLKCTSKMCTMHIAPW